MSKRVESPAICSSAQYSLGQNVQGQPACPHVPDLAYGLTMQRVLTMDFIDGCRVTDVAEIKNQGLNIPDVAGKFIECMSEQIFRTGFVHADPHPGNGTVPCVFCKAFAPSRVSQFYQAILKCGFNDVKFNGTPAL
eukprot:m.205301 g.205301  ORF g.205301 m.205301 type:complete len:136 (+) comp39658_c0_seq25:875-1282(+)